MTTAYAVIGANYGDEGKGLITDFLASHLPDATVVRYSAGAQAGHTVETPNGVRHVFGHFGSGSFVGNRTYLSKHFIVNPMLFRKEHEELLTKGVKPIVEIDGDCIVTTPWDMIINRVSRKGYTTCGVGINETVTRCEKGPRTIYADGWGVNLEAIEDYFWLRLDELGIKKLPEYFQNILNTKDLAETFKHEMEYLYMHSEPVLGMPKGKDIIFEGSQGLLLDPEYGTFPFVTRTSVGAKNAVSLAKEAEITEFHSIYVTRCYLTRHGEGPLPNEMEKRPDIGEKTNLFNNWQGEFRYAPLDITELKNRIAVDSIHTVGKGLDTIPFETVRRSLAVTCIDHSHKLNLDWTSLVTNVESLIGRSMILSVGPTRDTINDNRFKWTHSN